MMSLLGHESMCGRVLPPLGSVEEGRQRMIRVSRFLELSRFLERTGVPSRPRTAPTPECAPTFGSEPRIIHRVRPRNQEGASRREWVPRPAS